jgi:uncharacterized membrane protein YGL010W
LPGLAQYMAQYDHEHTSGWNKFLHSVGIPLIFSGLILLLLTKWMWGVGLFFLGWVLLFLGHRLEGNHPAFFQGPVYLLVGPIWVAREFWVFLTGSHRNAGADGSTKRAHGN